ncbi:HEPN domain-containing protein [Vibrio splendidus]
MKKYLKDRSTGEFYINDKKFIGEISLKGLKTSIKIWSDSVIELSKEEQRCFKGFIYDGNRYIALIDSFRLSSGQNSIKEGDNYSTRHFIEIHPRFVICGGSELQQIDGQTSKAFFSTKNLGKLFADYGSVTQLIHTTTEQVEKLVNEDNLESQRLFDVPPPNQVNEYVATDNEVRPEVFIYKGSKTLLSIESDFCHYKVRHFSGRSYCSSSSINVKVTTEFVLDFNKDTSIADVTLHVWQLHKFLQLLSGKSDTISEFRIQLPNNNELFEVYVCTDHGETDDHSFDGLISLRTGKQSIETLFANWFNKNPSWNMARNQVLSNFNSNSYTIDRLVSSANMFDLIPKSSANRKVDLSDELLEAKRHAKILFKALPDSLEKQSMLGTLGRIGNKSLKHIIHDRISIIREKSSLTLPDIDLVVNNAVDSRNYFVHGGKCKLDHEKNSQIVNFYIDTLEFIFVVSDLLECGWDIDTWKASRCTNHRIGTYLCSYSFYLRLFKEAIEKPQVDN